MPIVFTDQVHITVRTQCMKSPRVSNPDWQVQAKEMNRPEGVEHEWHLLRIRQCGDHVLHESPKQLVSKFQIEGAIPSRSDRESWWQRLDLATHTMLKLIDDPRLKQHLRQESMPVDHDNGVVSPPSKCLFCLDQFTHRHWCLDLDLMDRSITFHLKLDNSGLIHQWSDPSG